MIINTQPYISVDRATGEKFCKMTVYVYCYIIHTVMAKSIVTPLEVLFFEQNSYTLRFFDEITKQYFQQLNTTATTIGFPQIQHKISPLIVVGSEHCMFKSIGTLPNSDKSKLFIVKIQCYRYRQSDVSCGIIPKKYKPISNGQ